MIERRISKCDREVNELKSREERLIRKAPIGPASKEEAGPEAGE